MAYDPNNIGKYYGLRKRLSTNFLSIGEKDGQSIPFANRVWKNNSQNLQLGESTLMLGSYVGFLATEYSLFKKSGLNLSLTIKELFYAIEAINRLDLNAEPLFDSSYSKNLDGYLVRNDVPDLPNNIFLQNYPNLNSNSLPTTANGYITNSGRTVKLSNIPHSDKSPISRDHIIRILWGLLLAVTLLDDGVNLNQKKFSDGLIDFKKECRAIHSRIVTFLNNNNWKIRKPDGSFVSKHKGGRMRQDRAQITRSISNINNQPSSYTSPFQWFAYLWNGWMNGRITLEKQNLSGNRYRIWQRSKKFGYEFYFASYGILVYNWRLGSWFNDTKRKKELKEVTEFYLNVAPCDGNFKHNDNEFSHFGWALSDRSERSIRDAYFGLNWLDVLGNYNSMDYLLMHNLYYLNNFNSLGNFPEFKNQSCSIDCNYIDKTILDKELKRVKSFTFSQLLNDYAQCYISCVDNCFKNCNNQLNNCKNNALNNYNNCRNQCNNRRWWRRRICRTRCWIVYRVRRIACTISSLWCKARCSVNCLASCYITLKNQRKYYKDKLDEMSKIC